VIIARKLARVAWAIYAKHQPYNEHRVLNQHGDAGPVTRSTITYGAPCPLDKQIANEVIRRTRSARSLGNHNAVNPNKPADKRTVPLDSTA